MKTKFSIILPVLNGGEYFKQCVQSILAQSNADFELVVLDNCSTDGTGEWLARVKDERIRLFQSTRVLSIEDNWKRILGIPKAEYMTVIGHDDLFDHNYLEVMDELIKKHPDASLYHAHFRLIDTDGRVIRSSFPIPERENADEFLAARLTHIRDSYGTGYMMRSCAYDRLGGIPGYAQLLSADDALWLMLMRDSWKATAKEECFSYRLHAKSASHTPNAIPHLQAAESYVAFLKQEAARDKNLAEVLRRYAPGYFQKYSQHIYLQAVRAANQRGVRLDADFSRRIQRLCSEFGSETKMGKTRVIMLYEAVNRLPIRKIAGQCIVSIHKMLNRVLSKIRRQIQKT